uniref:Uncharacterized protein n=1 Tax=Arundo donax TaxID=35708 RepID=A0A0A8Z252_ARUDO
MWWQVVDDQYAQTVKHLENSCCRCHQTQNY